MKTTNDAAVYVGTYSKYNNGDLTGEWLNLEDYADREDFLTACRELHKDEADPELMFQDFQGFPRCWYSESSAPGEIVWEWLELSESERAAFGVYAEHMGGEVTIDDFRDAYSGTSDSEADFAEQIAEEGGEIPKDLPSWIVIDWQASWNCGLRFDYWCERDDDGNLHFFRNT
jgi:antirestriction protein